MIFLSFFFSDTHKSKKMFEGRNDHLRLNCNFSSGLEKKSFKEEEEEESCFYQSVCVCIDKILSQPF